MQLRALEQLYKKKLWFVESCLHNGKPFYYLFKQTDILYCI